MNDTGPSPICPIKPVLFWKLGDNICFVSYVIILPIYFLVCISAYSISLQAFLAQFKTESGYAYQLSSVTIKIFNVITFALFMLGFLGAGIERYGFDWYQNSYLLMWYSARASLPLLHATSIASLLMSNSMTADRIFALVKPFMYKGSNKKRLHNLALAISLCIGITSTFYNAFLFNVADQYQDPAAAQKPRYVVIVDINYVTSSLATVLACLSNAIRMLGLCSLIVLNLIMIKCNQQRLTKVVEITNRQQAVEKQLRQKNQKLSLLLLTLFQSIFTGVSMFSYICFYTAAYVVPFFNLCDSLLWASVLNTVLMICELADACAILLLNEKSKIVLETIMVRLNLKVCWKQGQDIVHIPGSMTATSAAR